MRVPYDDGNDRVYELTDVGVSSPTGAPSSVDRSESGGEVTLRIGDPDRTVSGRQEYVVTYTVDGALNAFDDHDELYWNAIGAEWQAPILAATATVELAGHLDAAGLLRRSGRQQPAVRRGGAVRRHGWPSRSRPAWRRTRP